MVIFMKYVLAIATAAILAVCFNSNAAAGGKVAGSGALRSIRFDEPQNARLTLKRLGYRAMIEREELIEADSKAKWRKIFQQHIAGLPVVGGRLFVNYDDAGRILSLRSSLAPVAGIEPPKLQLGSPPSTDDLIRLAKLSPSAKLVDSTQAILPRDGVFRAVWRSTLRVASPPELWDLFTDAETGELLLAEERLLRWEGRGLVFDPDPKSALGDSTLEDRDDSAEAIPEEAYREVTLRGIYRDERGYSLASDFVDVFGPDGTIRMEEPEFFFNREDDGFEHVMAYYHISSFFNNLEDNIGIFSWVSVNVNAIEDDVSYFDPDDWTIYTGSGGVDDAEDADVLIHEATHVVIADYSGHLRGDEIPFLIEGFCDYFAGDYSYEAAPEYRPFELYNWDGHNEFWAGRILNADYRYPDDADRQAHDAGQLWSSFLFAIRLSEPWRDDWNNLLLNYIASEFADSTTAPELARTLLELDQERFDGQFCGAIVAEGARRGILDREDYAVEISHTPLRDTESLTRREVVCALNIPFAHPGFDWDRGGVVYSIGGAEFDTVRWRPRGDAEDTYSAFLPALEAPDTVSYYLLVTDADGYFVTSPPDAPAETHSYFAGPDRIPPVIVALDTIPDSVFPIGEIVFGTTIRDNIGVRQVHLEWSDVGDEFRGAVALRNAAGSDVYRGRLNWNAGEMGGVNYQLVAIDAAENRNVVRSSQLSFAICNEMMIADFERDSPRWALDGWVRSNRRAYSGDWSLRDRVSGSLAPRSAAATLDEWWSLGGKNAATLIFREIHTFDRGQGEHGVVEVRVNGELERNELAYFYGVSNEWTEARVDLSRFARQDSPPIKVIFRSYTPGVNASYQGWFIDDLRLRVGNIVEAPVETTPLTGFSLSDLYPNPANGSLTFRITAPVSSEVKLLDVSGRVVLTLPIPQGEGAYQFDLRQYPSGSYLLIGGDPAETITRRFPLLK